MVCVWCDVCACGVVSGVRVMVVYVFGVACIYIRCGVCECLCDVSIWCVICMVCVFVWCMFV